jgi:hypothetical protein
MRCARSLAHVFGVSLDLPKMSCAVVYSCAINRERFRLHTNAVSLSELVFVIHLNNVKQNMCALRRFFCRAPLRKMLETFILFQIKSNVVAASVDLVVHIQTKTFNCIKCTLSKF